MKNMGEHYKRNMVLGVVNGIFFNLAAAFIHPGTVVPLFISSLTDSKVLIGLFSTLESFGWYFPQFFAGAMLAGSGRVLWFYNRMSIIRVVAFSSILGLIFILGDGNHSLLLAGFALFFGVYSISGGLAGVPFMEIIGKTIPTNKRGTLFGLRMFFGGLLAAMAGPVVKKIIASYDFPIDFGILYSLAFVCIVLGLSVFAFSKESPTTNGNSQSSYKENIRKGIALFKNDVNIRHLIIARFLSFCYMMAMPFYVIMANQRLGISKALAATYLSFEMVGYLGLNFLWAWLSNHISNRQVMKLAALCSFVPPVIGLFSLYKNPGYFIFGLAFFFNGAASSGFGVGFLNYLLEIVDDDSRSLTVGLVHTFVAPAAFMSIIGGIVIDVANMWVMFSITLALLMSSYIYIGRLKEPKR
jgi:MFS family permease